MIQHELSQGFTHPQDKHSQNQLKQTVIIYEVKYVFEVLV